MKKIYLFFLVFTGSLFAQTPLEKCNAEYNLLKERAKDLLTESKKALEQCRENEKGYIGFINIAEKLLIQQREEIRKFVKDGVKINLEYQNGKYYVTVLGEIYIYYLTPQGKVIPLKKITLHKKNTYKFDPILAERPLPYFPGKFKFGGGVFFGGFEVYPDILFAVEIFSFDKLFGLYGISINGSVGITHIGGNLSYQLIHTKYFRNTSIFFGYSYSWKTVLPAFYSGITLNF